MFRMDGTATRAPYLFPTVHARVALSKPLRAFVPLGRAPITPSRWQNPLGGQKTARYSFNV